MEQPNPVKCHLCGNTAEFAFAYARFSDREAFFGVIYRGVCRECLHTYIEGIKYDRHLRGELLLWPMVLLPVGALLAALSQSEIVQAVGFVLLGLPILIPALVRHCQRREARIARRASDAENEARYSEQMCREDALSTSRQTKLVYLNPAYASPECDPAVIAREAEVSPQTAQLIHKLSAAAQKLLLAAMAARPEPALFDKSDAL